MKKPAEQLKQSMQKAGEFIRKPENYGLAIAGGTITAGVITAAVLHVALEHKTTTTRSLDTWPGFIMPKMKVSKMKFSAGLNSTSTTTNLAAGVSEEEIPKSVSTSNKLVLELGGFWIGVAYCSSLVAIGLVAFMCCPRKQTQRTVTHADYSDDDGEDEEDGMMEKEEDEELYPLE